MAIALLLFVAAGCTEDSPATTAQTGAGGSSAGGGGAGGAGGMEGCTTDVGGAPSNAVCITNVRGRFIDEQAAGVPDLVVSVCGAIQCNPGMGLGDGTFDVTVGYFIPPADYAAQAHARELGKAIFYFRLPADAPGPVVELGDLPLLQMPATGPDVIVDTDMMGAPAQSVTSNGVTLDIDDGVALNLGFDDAILGEEGKKFIALQVPAEQHASYIDPSLNVTLLYAFYPFESSFRLAADISQYAKARLSFPNDAGWPAGTPVEMLALGTYIFPEWLTPAVFEVVATGVVSTDGSTIETNPGEGFEHLTWVGVRANL
jgi:hypothetical protein